MNNLPITEILPQLIDSLKNHNTIILSAPPGSGKSTELPAAIYESKVIEGKILLLQPRRMAARALAKRLAWRLDCQLGETVGFSVRHQKLVSAQTKVEVLTEGLLTRRLLSDPFLEGIGLVILDEFHERSAENDLALAALKEIQEISDLKILIMSATLDKSIADYLPGAIKLELKYQPYPLDIKYLPQDNNTPLEKQVYNGLKHLFEQDNNQDGDILVFLPGQKEIERTAALLEQTSLCHDLVIQQLYGALNAKLQDQVLNNDDLPACRRIILATNIAQTSLTVPRVRAVIDCGLQKRSTFDSISGFNRLNLERCSLAAATQRSGRAARLGPGLAIRLWSRQDELSMIPFDPPEIGVSDPAPHIIWIQAMQPGWYQKFPFINKLPNQQLWNESFNNLKDMGILEPDGLSLTVLGKKISQYPLPPRSALLLENSRTAHCTYLGATLAALTEEHNIISADQANDLSGDIEYRLQLLEEWEKSGAQLSRAASFSLNRTILADFLETRKQLLQLAAFKNEASDLPNDQLLPLLYKSFADHLAIQSSSDPHDYTMANMRGGRLDGNIAASQCPKLLLVLSAREGQRTQHNRAIIDLYLPLSLKQFQDNFPDLLVKKQAACWNKESESVVGSTVLMAGSLEIERHLGGQASQDEISALLLAKTKEYPPNSYLDENAINQIKYRLILAQNLAGDLGLPTYEELLQTALENGVAQCSSFKELKRLDWTKLLLSQLDWNLQNSLNKLLPDSFTMPRGQQVPITYDLSANGQVSANISAHIQEFYGLKSHPTIANGRLPLKLSLLAPNGRPAQITSDILTFWKESYPAVRKDLFGRYPKHNWPEDPINALSSGLGRKFKQN